MAKQIGYSNDSMQWAIDNGYPLVLFVSHSGDRSAFFITEPKQEVQDAAE